MPGRADGDPAGAPLRQAPLERGHLHQSQSVVIHRKQSGHSEGLA
jgi:hypothetical protein